MAASALRNSAGERANQSLAGIASGDLSYALAIDEGAKFNPAGSALEAQKSGNGYRLNGRKTFVAEGTTADRLIVLARTGGAAGEAAGLTLFDIEADRAGLTRSGTMTVDSRDFARIDLDGVEVTGDDIIGDLDNGLD
ncbi:acyl-CoA dehydrogenase, partial [Pseudomonas fluorescens]